jgi:hypothetical protein
MNPKPTKELHYGIQSTDEMHIGFFNYIFYEYFYTVQYIYIY